MYRLIGVCLLTLMVACTKDESTDQTVLEGKYLTSRLLDLSCAFIPDDKMPSLLVIKTNSLQYQFVLTRYNPTRLNSSYSDITLKEDGDLLYNGLPAGSWKPSALADDNKLLTFSIQLADQWVYFAGVKK